MRLICHTMTLVSAVLVSAMCANADSVTFQSIPNARGANDMSPDGRYIVGTTIGELPYLFDSLTNTMTILPAGGRNAVAVSDDGSVVLGEITDPFVNAPVAAIWKSSTGVWQSLGYLPNALNCPSRSDGYELSADGTVAVGLSWDGCSGRGFRWTQATGMIELQALANGGNRASALSADGNLIGGFAQGSFSRTPSIWNGAGVGQLLDPPNGDALGEVYGINEPGTIMLGSWIGPGDQSGKAVTWTNPGLVRTVIGAGSLLPGWGGNPMDISNNGTIVGFDFFIGSRRAWIYFPGNGPIIDLATYVTSNGGTIPGGITLEVCQAISNDGLKIIGHGFASGAWIVQIQKSCPADVAPTGGNTLVNVDDLLAVINSWGRCPAVPNPCAADIAPSGGNSLVNVDDLLAVINAWGPCPSPTGACCNGSSCMQSTQSNCELLGGTYLGNSVPCHATACINNDHCADAINITANINGAPVQGDNSSATPTFGGGDPELPGNSPSCHWAAIPGAAHSTVWYTFTAPANGQVTIGTCSSPSAPFSDSTLTLHAGSCGGMEVGCSEDDCSNPQGAQYLSRIIATTLTPGATYYVCVMNPGEWSGSLPGPFVLTITSP